MSEDLTKVDLIDLTYTGLCESVRLQTLRRHLREAQAKIEAIESNIRMIEQDYDRVKAELNARNYHDVGHARDQFESKFENGKRIRPLLPEERDSRVTYYLAVAGMYASNLTIVDDSLKIE